MAAKTLDNSLVEALQWAALRELPPVDDKENIWIYALALVSKRDGSKGYCILIRDKSGENRVIKDFGSISQTVKIEEIYPYLYLDSTYLPEFKGQKKDDRIKWLTLMGAEGNFEEMSIKELNREVVDMAIKNQLRNLHGDK